MPENSEKTRVKDIAAYTEKVRKFLRDDPAPLTSIISELELTKPQTLTVLQRMEEGREIRCKRGYWQLVK
jgi:predicted Rossmann fold nucleotide-binding protein DprA/Smf involved in DNA uptake